MDFLESLNVHWSLFLGSNRQDTISWCDGIMPNRRLAIIWPHDDQVYIRIDSSQVDTSLQYFGTI